jgi:hypothetical protein
MATKRMSCDADRHRPHADPHPEPIVKFFRDHHWPSFREYSEHPYVSCEEIRKALNLKAAFSTALEQMQ